MQTPVDIFIAYSHDDLGFKNDLKKFLQPMLREKRISLWDDFDIEAGQEWNAEIKKRLYGADMVLLLISADSLASDYFYGQEVEISLKRHAKQETIVVPIILRHCDWEATPIGELEALPEKGRPVVDWPTRDHAYKDVVNKLRLLVETVAQRRMQESERAEKERQFLAACEAARHMYEKQSWEEASWALTAAMMQWQPGFVPDTSTLKDQRDEALRQIDEAKKAAQQAIAQQQEREKRAKQAQAEAEHKQREAQAAEALRLETEAWQAAVANNTPEAFEDFVNRFPQSGYARQAREHAKKLRQPANTTGDRPPMSYARLLLIGLSIIGLAFFAKWAWSAERNPSKRQEDNPTMATPLNPDPNQAGGEKPKVGTVEPQVKPSEQKPTQEQPKKPKTQTVDTEARDYKAAKAAGTIPALTTFINKSYPQELYESQAKAELSALQRKFDALIRDAKIIQGENNARALNWVEEALKIKPGDEGALRLRARLKPTPQGQGAPN